MYQSQSSGGRFAALVFIAVFLCAAFLVVTPTSVAVQTTFAVLAVLAALVLSRMVDRALPRLLFLVLCTLVMLRYLAWRYVSTMPSPDDPVSFVAASLLLGAETWMIAIFLLGAFMMADPQRRNPALPARGPDSEMPSVDVLVPSLNEPEDLLAVTLAAAKRMDYPPEKLTVVLCDDGGTDQRCNDPDPLKAHHARQRRARLSALCERLGVVYKTRPANIGAKAGNLNEAMLSLRGELVAIFDADHAPTPDFLRRTVGYFGRDPRLFLVQTPHMFLNSDPIARNLGVEDTTPPENEMFYGQLHDGLGRWEGAFFCGSAALLRRAALDEVGGISGETITEDAETALDLHARGWRSLYVNRAMIAGLQPETFGSMIGQRGRWATGMIQILLLKNPLFRRGLRLSQRLCYLNSMAFWFFPVTRMIMLAAPLAYLLFDIELFVTTKEEALAYMLGYIGVSLIAQHALFARTRWPFQSEIYEIAQAPYLLRAVLGTLVSPRGATFKVTAKDESVQEDRISEIARPLVLLFLVMAGGAGLAVWRYMNEPGSADALLLVGSWAVVNMILTGAALGAVVDRMQRRGAPRVTSLRAVGIQIEGTDTPVDARLVNVSTGGAAVDVLPGAGWAAPSTNTRVTLSVADHGATGSIEARVAGYAVVEGVLRLRLAFTGATDEADATMRAALVHADSRLWEARRADQMQAASLLYAVFWALRLFFAGVPNALIALLRGKRPEKAPVAAAGVFPAMPDQTVWSAQPVSSEVNGVNAQTLGQSLMPDRAPPVRASSPTSAAMIGLALALGLAVAPSPVASQSVPLPAPVPPTVAPSGEADGVVLLPVPTAPTASPTTLRGADPAEGDPSPALPEAIAIPPGFPGGGRGATAEQGLALLPLRVAAPEARSTGTLRLEGQLARRGALLVLPEGARPRDLEIAFQNSAFVLPEGSQMRVSLNGTVLGTTALDHIAERETARFAIPAGVPVAGRNVVVIDVAQTHRLYCGAEASYDLWTDIDLSVSGVRVVDASLAAPGLDSALAQLAAAPGGRIGVVSRAGPSGADPLGLPGARASVAVLSSLIGGSPSFEPTTEAGAMIEFVQGPRPQVLRTPSGLRIVLGSAGEAPLPALEALGDAAIGPDALRAIRVGAVPLPLGTPTPLGALGLEDGIVTTDRWERELAFTLPADYLAAGGRRAELSLTFAHVAGLPAGSVLRVLVNGTSVRMIPADSAAMVRETAVPVRFDAGLLGAGRNTLTLQFERSAGDDPTACPLAGQTRAEIAPESTLMVPGMPSFAVSSLDGILAGVAAADVGVGARPDPFGPADTPQEAAQALTLASALGVQAQPDGPGPDSSRRVGLRVVAREDVASIPMGPYGAVAGRIAALLDAEAAPPAVRLAPETPSAPEADAPAVPGLLSEQTPEPRDPFAPADTRLLSEATIGGGAESVQRAELLPRPEDGPRALLADLRDRFLPEPVRSLDLWLSAQGASGTDGRIALIALDETRPDEAFLVASPGLAAADQAAALAAAQSAGGRLTGHVALWSAADGWVVWADPRRLPVLAEPLRFDNAHAVIAAYAEQRPLGFVAAIFAVALFVAAIASAALVAGRRPV